MSYCSASIGKWIYLSLPEMRLVQIKGSSEFGPADFQLWQKKLKRLKARIQTAKLKYVKSNWQKQVLHLGPNSWQIKLSI